MVDKIPESSFVATIETTKCEKKKLDSGESLINQYKIMKRIGEGGFSIVKLVECQKTKTLYACKIYNKKILEKKRELIRSKNGKVEYRD